MSLKIVKSDLELLLNIPYTRQVLSIKELCIRLRRSMSPTTPSSSSHHKPLRVGFDFDGVIMYNPARVIRPIVSFFKKRKLVFKRKELEFFIPHNRFQRIIWWALHQSSLFPAVGVKEIEALVKSGEIEAYVITGRFGFLKGDFERWYRKIGGKKIFKNYFVNELDEQPHLFKERKIQELNLDVFIEDNWDIVNYLSRKHKNKLSTKSTRILWIFNIFDRKISYPHRFSQLKDALKYLKQEVLFIQKPRLVALSDFFYPHWTGLSKSIYNLFVSLSDQFDIQVLTVKHMRKLKKTEVHDRLTIIRSTPLFQLSRTFVAPSVLLKWYRFAKQADVLFINSPCTYILPATLIGKFLRKKVVIFHQGDLRLPTGLLNAVIEFIFSIMTIIAFVFADRLSTYTRDYAQHSRVLKYFMYKTVPILLPISAEKNNPLPISNKKSQLVFGFAGRFVEEKGFDILFQAIPEIVEHLPHARFVFAGQTKMSYESFYEKHEQDIKKVKEYVTFLGLLNDKELRQFYRSLDFFLLTSRSECFGLVQAEAMLQGTPVIASNIPGARYPVKKTKFGKLFESENPSDLADKLIEAVEQYDQILAQAPKAQELFDFHTLVEKSKKLFEF